MTRRVILLAILFTGMEALAALLLLAVSVHGPDYLTIAAPVYFLVAAGLTWWAARRLGSMRTVLVVGVLALAAAPGVIALLSERDRWAHERRIAGTRVSRLRDEPILSAIGRPIGVRVSYTVSVPARGYFGILPMIHSRDPRTASLRLDALRWTIDGRSEPTPFEPGHEHAMDVELYPPLIAIVRGERCLAGAAAPALPDPGAPVPLRVWISETRHSAVYGDSSAVWTRGEYDLAELYRGALAENYPPCRGAEVSPG